MPEHSFSLKLPSTCTAGVRILASLPNSNSMARTVSLNARDPISTSFNLSNTTPEPLILVSTCTHSLSALRNINPAVHATFPELITLFSSSSFLPELFPELPLPKSVFMPLITTFSV
jgi:hypothetical protein